MDATITLEYDDEKTAEAIYRAVSPDNFETPPGLSVKTMRINKNVITEISAETKIATFNATIDDLLFSASTAEKALGIIKKSKP